MNPSGISRPAGSSFATGLSTQFRVIGALLMRELHTRYGRENIGYLWLIGEPLMLASVMALLHHSGHTAYGSDIKPLPFVVLGYTTFIMFRGIVNRSDSALTANAPLLYHRMVTIFDIVTSRALLEAAGTVLAYSVLMALLWSLGLVALPARPLYLYAAQALMFWYALGNSMIIASITFHNRTIERLVHPYSYFMIPLSGAFFQTSMIPEPYRSWLMLVPLPHIMELARYGQFKSANLDYCDPWYVVASCVVLTWVGLVTMRIYRNKVHLN
jgi:capsular polysaccharide transport system permease protein